MYKMIDVQFSIVKIMKNQMFAHIFSAKNDAFIIAWKWKESYHTREIHMSRIEQSLNIMFERDSNDMGKYIWWHDKKI